ncbi:hypothetical protein JST97_34000 [bacterium]|nr:hypothetical protein [bacterium]
MKRALVVLTLSLLGRQAMALPVTTEITRAPAIQLVEPEMVELPAAPEPENFASQRLIKTVRSLQLGPQSGIVKVLGDKKKVLWTRGFDDQKVARLSPEEHQAIFVALQIPQTQMVSLSQQLMAGYSRLPHAQTVALLGAVALEPALTRADRQQIEDWLNQLLKRETKDMVTRRQALLALALLPEVGETTVTTMLRTYETSHNLWETFPIGQFVQYHAVDLLQRPDGEQIKQRLSSVPSIYTPVMLEEMARQDPPQATLILDDLH